MLSKIRSKSSLATGFSGRLEVVKEFVYTITTRQDRCPNSGLIEYEKNKYRILTEKECWRLMGFDDDDFINAKSKPWKNEKYKNTTLYHQAGNSIVVPVLEAIFECLLPESE